MSETPQKLVPDDWAKCIDPKGVYGPLIAIIENSEWLGKSQEPMTFLECIQRAQDVQKGLQRPEPIYDAGQLAANTIAMVEAEPDPDPDQPHGYSDHMR